MNLTPRLTAARARATAAEQRNVVLRLEVDTLRRDRDAYAAAITRLREQVAALDARNDSLRREVAHWETGHAACERARQLVERDAEAAQAAADLGEEAS